MSYTEERYGSYLGDEEYWREHITRNVLAHLNASDLEEVLDFGCGAGRGTIVLAESAKLVVGIDPNAQQIEAARPYARRNCSFEVVGDLSGWLEKRPARFSCVLLDNVIEHLPTSDAEAVLRRLLRSLRPSGKLIVLTPNAAGPIANFLRYDDLTHTTCFTANSLRLLLVSAGFDDVSFVDYYAPGKAARRLALKLLAHRERWKLRANGYRLEHTSSTLVAIAAADKSTLLGHSNAEQ